jgi:hypothetical protein
VKLLRNLLALVGLLALIGIGAAILAFEPFINKARSLDDAALTIYAGMARTILATGDAMEAVVYRKRVAPGRSASEVEEILGRVAAELELHSLGTTSVHREVQAQTGHGFPFLQVYLFCDPELAADLIRHNPAMAAFLPCRVILHRDETGALWLMTPNLDLVVHGGRPLPVALQERSAGLQVILRTMVDRAAGIDS